MAQAQPTQLVKLICGMISADESLFDEAREYLEARLGPCDIVSPTYAFDFTHYYDDEMGNGLLRRFVGFANLVDPSVLASAKVFTNEVEAIFSARPGPVCRPINLDVGYVEMAKLVLASMKNFSHRVYLGQGVYAEVTLTWHKKGWRAHEWTFPDYASGRYRDFLDEARLSLVSKLD